MTIGFNGTFTAIADIFTTLTECCANLQQDFEDTWTILADIKQTITTDFNGTFTALAVVMGGFDILVDFSGVYTAAAAGFNGTYTALADLKNTITVDFDGTFTSINALTACLAIPLSAGTNITSPGYYCLTNDVTGSFTITANNVVLDLSNRTVSSGGIFVLTGTNRTVKNGRLNSSSSGIVLTSNANTLLSELLITNATTVAITSSGTPVDNRIEDVVIESCVAGLSSTNDVNFQIKNLSINDTTSFGMSFTQNNNPSLYKVTIMNTDSNGLEMTNVTNANVTDVTLNTVTNAGIITFGTTERCTFENIVVCNSPNISFGMSLNLSLIHISEPTRPY